MTYESTFLFALVTVVGAFAVAAWHISDLKRRISALESLRATTASNFQAISKQLADARQKAPATLAAEVAELSVAVNKLAQQQAKFAGRFYATQQHKAVSERDSGNEIVDDEVAAHLALQTAAPVRPGH